jgi:hypothetical protein
MGRQDDGLRQVSIYNLNIIGNNDRFGWHSFNFLFEITDEKGRNYNDVSIEQHPDAAQDKRLQLKVATSVSSSVSKSEEKVSERPQANQQKAAI